jgi:hypothetical protein
MLKETIIKELLSNFFSLDIIKDTKIQIHLENSIIGVNVEQFLTMIEIIVIENIIFKSNSITNLLKNEIKKITIEVVFNKNIEKLNRIGNLTITKKFKKINTEVSYVNVIDLNKILITIPSLDILDIELTFSTLSIYLK